MSTQPTSASGSGQDVTMIDATNAGSNPAATAPAAIVPGRRAKLTEETLMAASRKVMKVLTDKSMLQCFPEFEKVFEDAYGKDEGKVQLAKLMKGLKDMVETHFNAGVPIAWADMCARYEFIERANDLDRVVEAAKLSQRRGDAPRNLYITGADGEITMPNATVPVLRSGAAALRAKRLALAEKNAATFERIQQRQATVVQTEGQISKILDDFTKSMQVLRGIDMDRVLQLQEQVLKVIPIDAA